MRAAIPSGIALAALCGVVFMQQSRLDRAALNPLSPQQADQQEALQIELMKRSPTLGFDNAIANWAFIKFIGYFGDEELRDQTGYELNDDYFDLLTQRDPRFMEAYLFISSAVSFMQAKPELGVKLMQRGTEVLSPEINPRSYLLWRYKGIDQLLLVNDIPGAIKSHEIAAEWVKGTPDEKFASIYAQTAEFLKSNPDNTDVRFWAWSEVYYSTVDKNVKARAEAELLKLGANKRVDEDGNIYFALPVSNNKQR
ncbi:hypothetical protein H6G72_05585 [Planktothricoides sp. FACHB-1370]|uniref:Uncharacterized protein n=1 Tax=Planktothricoides raciborskii FACHB-1370 TaxID=2949576 RepID=A0ABR8ECJ1_9CYAN|nr:hypothetical protein [Planktothricoides raciborskii FACHB-1370]MBD2581632.1 hypothetical protein [Planktothricoides raciborskii FACHB-1261]